MRSASAAGTPVLPDVHTIQCKMGSASTKIIVFLLTGGTKSTTTGCVQNAEFLIQFDSVVVCTLVQLCCYHIIHPSY